MFTNVYKKLSRGRAVVLPLKVIQGHYCWYQWKARTCISEYY